MDLLHKKHADLDYINKELAGTNDMGVQTRDSRGARNRYKRHRCFEENCSKNQDLNKMIRK